MSLVQIGLMARPSSWLKFNGNVFYTSGVLEHKASEPKDYTIFIDF